MAILPLVLLMAGLPASQPRVTLHTPRVAFSDSLSASIGRRIAEVNGAVVGVAFHDLESGRALYLNADDSFHAASTMKVPVMIELFRRVDAGKLRLDDS